jgi:hypothetical protein
MQLGAAVLLVLFFALPGEGQFFRYGRYEQAFESHKDYANPIRDVTVTVEFIGPRRQIVEAAAFWDGGRTWKVRFSPDEAGTWRYEVRSSDPTDRGLHRKAGGFLAPEYRGRNELYRRGRIRLAADRRHFVHADGTPWFWLGCTAWNGALLSTAEEWDRYLTDRAGKRFSAVQFVMTQWRAGREDELGQKAFSGTNSVRVNPAFFQRLDKRFEAINDKGLVAAPVMLWALSSDDKESPGEVLPADQAILLAKYMAARYDAFHVVWLLGGDGDYTAEKAQKWKNIGRNVFSPARSDRIVTLHPRGLQDPWEAFRSESWLTFLMYQSGHGNDSRKWRWNATGGPAAGRKLEPPRPVIDGEINYEGHLDYQTKQPISDYQVRRAAYYSLLSAPPAGVTYGAHGIWPWNRKPQVPLAHPRAGVAPPWQECLDWPGAQQMKILRDTLDLVKWWRLRPDRSLLSEDPVNPEFSNYIMPARSADGDAALIYLPGNPYAALDLTGFAGQLDATWIDPRTGKRIPAAERLPPGIEKFPAPGPGDWLLWVRKR